MVTHSDVLLDSSVIRSGLSSVDSVRSRDLVELLDRMLPRASKVWVAGTTLMEILGGSEASALALVIELKRLSGHFGSAIGIFPELDKVVRAESSGDGIPVADLRDLAPAIDGCIRAGRLIGAFEQGRASWLAHREKVRANHELESARLQEAWAEDSDFRSALIAAVQQFFAPAGLAHADDVLVRYFGELGLDVSKVERLKASWTSYPSCWTYALLRRLRDFAVTIPPGQLPRELESFADVLEPHPNDLVDAEIAAVGAQCGALITDDTALARRILRLTDAGLTRAVALPVSDWLQSWPR